MERFLIPFSLPASLIVARALGLMWQRGMFMKTLVMLIVLMLSYNLIKTTVTYAYPSEYIHLYNLKRLAKLLPKLTKKPFYLDFGSADKMRFLTYYASDLVDIRRTERNLQNFPAAGLPLILVMKLS